MNTPKKVSVKTDDSLAKKKADILKALAHPVRITIFEAVASGEKTVGELVAILGEKEANTSRHLAVMRGAGLVSARKQGLNVYYSVKMECMVSTLKCLSDGVCAIADEHGRMAKIIKSKESGKQRRKNRYD